MANYNGQNFTSFSGVNVRGSVALRFAADVGGNESTLSVRPSQDAARAWTFPDKSGTFPVTGTIAVNLPAIAAHNFAETAITISGLRREDAFMAVIRDLGYTTVTGTTKTYPFIAGARPENGYAYFTFYNPTSTATVYSDLVLTYTTAR